MPITPKNQNTTRRGRKQVKAYLIILALALCGLLGNYVHLQSLTAEFMIPDYMMDHYTYKRRRSSQLVISQDDSFRRILRRSTQSQRECHRGGRRLLSQKKKLLSHFGMAQDMTTFLSEESSTKRECVLPPTTSCHVSGYSMLVTAFGSDLRTLFLNLLTYLTFKNVEEILVLMNDSAELQKDVMYGHRILSWHKDASHKVRILSSKTSLWDTLVPENFNSEAVLWMDGAVLWDGNGRSIEVGFQLWKRHSQSLVASRGWRVRIQGASPNWLSQQAQLVQQAWELEEGTPRQRLQQSFTGSYYDYTPLVNSTRNNFLPTCRDWKLSLDGYEYEDFQLVDTSGLFVHRKLLCFLHNAAFRSLQTYVERKASVMVDQMAVSVILTHVSGELPRSYPRIVIADKQKQTTRVAPHPIKAATQKRRMGENVTEKIVPIHPLNAAEPREIAYEQQHTVKSMDGAVHTKRRRRLATIETKPQSVNDKTLTSIVGYFGNMPPGSIGWCLGSSMLRVGDRRCFASKEVPILEIPWMKWGGFGNALCHGWTDKLF